MKISSILDRIDEQQMFVPAFQREYVWKRENAKELIYALINEYPTGTLLIWETANPPELKGPHRYRPEQGAVRVLLDGQQRVTTLYMLIRGEFPPYYTAEEITHDIRGLHVNLATIGMQGVRDQLEYYKQSTMEGNPYWQDITKVFQGRVDNIAIEEQFEALGRPLPREDRRILAANIAKINRIRDREFPEQTIPIKASIREAIDIFYLVNSSGVTLTEAELCLAQISGYWPEARDTFKAKLTKLRANGFILQLDFIVYALLACVHHTATEMKKLHGAENDADIRAAWKRLDEDVLDYVVNLLHSNAYVDHSDEINSIYALIPIIAWYHDLGGRPLTGPEIRKVVRWFYYSQIRGRYTGQLLERLNQDLRTVQTAAQPFDDLLNVIAEQGRMDITPQDFVGHAVQHPLFSLMRWYFKSRNAVCLDTGLTLRRNMGAKYQLERDHIFPTTRLKKAGYGHENRLKYALAQEITNRAILTQVANRTKAGASAEAWLAGVHERHPGALALQCIPENPELWKIEHFELFLEERRKTLAVGLTSFLNSFSQTPGGDAEVPLETLIERGESGDLEFKETFGWDIQKNSRNRDLEDAVVKAVAAFGNQEGGTLLIGVADSGEVKGLQRDFATLKEPDADAFERHLRGVLGAQLGATFVSTKVRVRFPLVGETQICRVDVGEASTPIFVDVNSPSGKRKSLYIRDGNQSRLMDNLEEMTKFIRERFPG